MKRFFYCLLGVFAFLSSVSAEVLKSGKIYVEKGTVWVGEKEFLYCLDKSTEGIAVFAIPDYISSGKTKTDEVLCINKVGEEMLIGTRGNGLLRFLPADNTFARYKSMQWVYSTIYDVDTDNLWVGTICRLYGISGGKTSYVDMPGTAFSSNFFILDILQDGNKNVWVASAGGNNSNLFRYDISADIADEVLAFVPYGDLTKMLYDTDGNLWVGSYENGLLKYSNGVVTEYNTTSKTLPDNYVSDLKLSDDGLIWLICGGRLMSFDKGTADVVAYPFDGDNDFKSIAIDGNIVWVLSSKALYSYSMGSGLFDKKIDFSASVSGVEAVPKDKNENGFLYDISGKRISPLSSGKIAVTSSGHKIMVK